MQSTIIAEAPAAHHRSRHLGYDEWKENTEPEFVQVVVKGWDLK